MNFYFDKTGIGYYKNNSQKIRVMSEHWVENNIFCPCCGNSHIIKLENNKPAADFQCDNCKEVYELKSKKGKMGKKISDGAYLTMIERIKSIDNPNLFLLNYSSDLQVTNLLVIPKFFFVADTIEKRKPLSSTAQRAGWIGCNILFSNIPDQGKIKIIDNQKACDINNILSKYDQIKKLQTNNLNNRGWLLDVLNCINSIPTVEFCLADVYQFTEKLQRKYFNNHNIEAKIKQQLQFLRDKGFIEFVERGYYRKINDREQIAKSNYKKK
ncbi:MAG: restriction endonuclease [Lachnospiraceae bacterium]